MAADLEERAQARLELLRTWSDRAGTDLGVARLELDRRHPDPSSVDPDDWADPALVGATQHVATARAALSALRTEQDRIRAQLAAVTNPADTATYEAELRASLITDAGHRVRLRLGEERVAAAEAGIARLSDLVEVARAAVAAGEAELKAAARRQTDGAALRAKLAEAPLDTLVADATALRTSTTLLAAEDRLEALLLDPLRSRALARAGEAADGAAAAAEHRGAGQLGADRAREFAAPLDVAVASAERDFVQAESELRRYVYTARADLAAAETVLTAIAGLPDLTAAQQAALNPDNRAGAVAAAAAEGALAVAVAALAEKERKRQDAIIDALLADPDADPEQNLAVIAATKERDAADIQDPLTAARGDYDDAARAALDDWEVEVPLQLWGAVVDFAAVSRTLERLADQEARDDLVGTLDAAQDALAKDLDARDVQVRRELAVAITLVPRAGAAAAASTATADRTSQYVRGDGPGGRTPGQL
ncbi:MAG: hypothetical protein ACRDRR_00360 [Pseudonocardiaceae bacterium]